MNAATDITAVTVREVDLRQPDETSRIDAFIEELDGTIFHRPDWLLAIEQGTGHAACGLVAEQGGAIVGWLPYSEVHSPIFGRMLASSGFGVGGGILSADDRAVRRLSHGICRIAQQRSCPTVELRGGDAAGDFVPQRGSHSEFSAELAPDDDAQLLAIPRKQRAEIRKSLKTDLEVTVGTAARDRKAHYAVYSTSVHNLGTPVFPRTLFEAVLDRLEADILTVWSDGVPVSSVLSLYHGSSVMPYWGGGTAAARRLRSNDRMYYELMRHARRHGCTRFDFGRSKTGSGPYLYKKTWGFTPVPLAYHRWTAPGQAPRDADPTSAAHQSRIEVWKRLPLPLANRIGPFIARGLA